MKNYQYLSTDILCRERDRLSFEIADWEKTLSKATSYLVTKYLNFAIKQAKEKIHAIEAELCYREYN